jgi:hypothetical protein
MGYPTKIQRVDRPTNQSFYAIIPTALAQSFELEKAEEFDCRRQKHTYFQEKYT